MVFERQYKQEAIKSIRVTSCNSTSCWLWILYDKGFLSVNKGILEQSKALDLSKLDIMYENHKIIDSYNSINHVFFDYHYQFIYKHKHNHKTK